MSQEASSYLAEKAQSLSQQKRRCNFFSKEEKLVYAAKPLCPEDAKVQFNGVLRDNAGQPIWCRHLAYYWLLVGKQYKEKFHDAYQNKSFQEDYFNENHFDTYDITRNADAYFVFRPNEFGETLYQCCSSLNIGESKKLYFIGHNHAMGIEVKRKDRYVVVNFYDPNLTTRHLRAVVADLEGLKILRLENILPQEKIIDYQMQQENYLVLQCYEQLNSYMVSKFGSIYVSDYIEMAEKAQFFRKICRWNVLEDGLKDLSHEDKLHTYCQKMLSALTTLKLDFKTFVAFFNYNQFSVEPKVTAKATQYYMKHVLESESPNEIKYRMLLEENNSPYYLRLLINALTKQDEARLIDCKVQHSTLGLWSKSMSFRDYLHDLLNQNVNKVKNILKGMIEQDCSQIIRALGSHRNQSTGQTRGTKYAELIKQSELFKPRTVSAGYGA